MELRVGANVAEREVIKQETERVDPEWIRVYGALAREKDFDLAVRNCDEELFRRRTQLWMENALSERPYRRVQAISDREKKWGD